MPIFWWGLILIGLISVQWGLTPVSGRLGALYDVEPWSGFLLIDSWFSENPGTTFLNALHHLILPSFVLATIPLASIARITRSSLLEVACEDYIRTARAKGMSSYRVWFRHILHNALIPIITMIGLMVGVLLTGAILTETLFAWPGIGRWMVASVESRDYPVIQGGILIIALILVTVNLMTDLIYLWINPMLKKEHL